MGLLGSFVFRRKFFLLVLVLSLFLPLLSARAGEGVFLLGNDALQLGRASSGVASPRSAYWSYMNPASMVDLERRLDVNWYSVLATSKMTPRGMMANPFDGTLESKNLFNIVSTGFIIPLKTGTLGGGLFIPSGAGVDYAHSRTWLGRLQGNTDRRLSYQHIRGVLSYAYRFDNDWSLGVGLHLSLNRFRTDHITLGMRGAKYDNKWDNALGAGVGFGVYRAWEKLSVGLSYSSRHWTQSMDKYSDLLRSPLDTPRTLQVGLAYRFTPKFEVTADYKWLHWRRIRTYGSPMFRSGGFGWTNQNGFKLGAEWKVHPQWTLAAGYAYSNTPVRKDAVFLSALVPVVVEHHVTMGISHAINEKHEVHLSGVYAFRNREREAGCGDLMSIAGYNTTIESKAVSAVAGYSYKW
ncbi:MAG: porin [Candidatus Hydrogenedens sp.]|nr:porin [Candidatus Hydrogenedens sp.]